MLSIYVYAFSLNTALGMVLTAGTTAPAQAESNILARLDATGYDLRQAATVTVLALRSLAVHDLEALYTTAKTPEQRHRLLSAARHHLLRQLREKDEKSGRGSLGIRHKLVAAKRLPHVRQPAFQVAYTLPGFPAHEVLSRGDLILALDGRRFEQHHQALANQIRSKGPGQTVQLTILRDGKTIVVPVQLAGWNALQRMYPKAERQPPSATQPVLGEPYRSQWIRFHDKLVALGPPVKTLPITAGEPRRSGNEPSKDLNGTGDAPDQSRSVVDSPG